MTWGHRAAAVLTVCSITVTTTRYAEAQEWGADLYAGGTRYEALAGRVSARNLIANVRHQSSRGMLSYLSLAAPLDETAAPWSAAGVSGRLEGLPLSGRFGLDWGAHAYAYRDSGAERAGGGVTIHALPHVQVTRNSYALELRGGRHEHLFSLPDTSGERGLFELGLRARAVSERHSVQADLRWLNATEGGYPYLGAQGATARGRARLWGWAGKWWAAQPGGPTEVEWGLGGGVTLAGIGEVWTTVGQEAGDPLVESGQRRTWNLGFSRVLGGRRVFVADLAPRVATGAVQIRLPESELPGGRTTPAVAGDFSGWRPTPMRKTGDEWVLELPLPSGTYHFAFVDEAGVWFVPTGYPGRMDDGMGGHVALMVVP